MKQTLTFTVSFTVDPFLAFAPAVLPHAVVGVEYPATSIGTVTGGAGPYVFNATVLPNGMTLSTDGLLSGTPTSEGSTDIAGTITDSGTP